MPGWLAGVKKAAAKYLQNNATIELSILLKFSQLNLRICIQCASTCIICYLMCSHSHHLLIIQVPADQHDHGHVFMKMPWRLEQLKHHYFINTSFRYLLTNMIMAMLAWQHVLLKLVAQRYPGVSKDLADRAQWTTQVRLRCDGLCGAVL